MVQQIRDLLLLQSFIMGSIPSSYVVAYNHVFQRNLHLLLASEGTRLTHSAWTYMQANTQECKINQIF